VNRGWPPHAKEVSAADAVKGVTFVNPGTASLTIRELKFGPSHRTGSELARVTADSRALSERSGGAFDATNFVSD